MLTTRLISCTCLHWQVCDFWRLNVLYPLRNLIEILNITHLFSLGHVQIFTAFLQDWSGLYWTVLQFDIAVWLLPILYHFALDVSIRSFSGWGCVHFLKYHHFWMLKLQWAGTTNNPRWLNLERWAWRSGHVLSFMRKWILPPRHVWFSGSTWLSWLDYNGSVVKSMKERVLHG